MDWTNLKDVLTWLIGAGAPALTMILLSLLAENWKQWSTFPSWVKFFVPVLCSTLLSVGAGLLLKYPELLAQIQPWFQIVVSAILAYIASQKTYQNSMNAGYGKRYVQLQSNDPKLITAKATAAKSIKGNTG